MNPQGKVISEDINGEFDTEVTGLVYDIQKLSITVEVKKSKAVVQFEEVIGFRVLDEIDLIEFWPTFSSPRGWLFLVESGGWKELESVRVGFVRKDWGLNEYFVTGCNECVSIISGFEPTITIESHNKNEETNTNPQAD